MSSYTAVRRELSQRVGSGDGGGSGTMLPCRYCGEPTPLEAMSMQGARCGPCFEQWQRVGYSGAQPAPQCKQAPWVKAAALKLRRTHPGHGGAFDALAAAIDAAKSRRAGLRKGLSVDEVNAMVHDDAQP